MYFTLHEKPLPNSINSSQLQFITISCDDIKFASNTILASPIKFQYPVVFSPIWNEPFPIPILRAPGLINFNFTELRFPILPSFPFLTTINGNFIASSKIIKIIVLTSDIEL